MQNIIDKLHPLELKVLPFLKECTTFNQIVEKAPLKDVEIMRALQWLSNKKLVTLHESKKSMIHLGQNGKKYAEEGLPEYRFLKVLSQDKFISVDNIKKKASLDNQEFGVSMGVLKKKVAIETKKENNTLMIKLTVQGKKLLDKPSLEKNFLQKNFPIDLLLLKDEDKFAFDNLIKRKDVLQINDEKKISVTLSDKAKKILDKPLALKGREDTVTSEMLRTGSWKDKKFRHYDININVPAITGGKRHFVKQSIDYIKKVWLELGFKEMVGFLVQSSFWDLDALFVPQDHPARTMQDTFYIKDPKKAKIPSVLKNKIKNVHENGANTGSKGWGGKWSEKEASQNMLRTHTTVLSAQTISKLKKEDLPAKFFSVNKVFRNEALTWKHLFEFHQVEGIVIDPNATLKHLKGYLKEFYKKLGYEKVRMRPGYFPYTEPSLEVDVYHPEKKEWIELGGAGIFRPEVVKPLLGFECPVLAWGQGLERGIMQFYKFTDIRTLYDNDLKILKDVKIWR